MNFKNFLFCFISLFFFSTLNVYAQENSFYEEFPEYSVNKIIHIDKHYDFIELKSTLKKQNILLYVNNKRFEYNVIFESKPDYTYYNSEMYYSKKSETLYYNINASPQYVNNHNIYYDAGLYSFSKVKGKFCKEGMKRYFLPADWMFFSLWDSFEKYDDYNLFLDYVYSISDSCEKSFCVKTENGQLLTDKEALSHIRENNLYFFSTDIYIFLHNYLKRIENGNITEKSAYTLNGNPFLKDTLCKKALYDCAFIESDDGIWLIKENSHPQTATDGAGNQYEKWVIDYLTPYLLEDKDGKIAAEENKVLKTVKICPVKTMDDIEQSVISYKGYLLLRDINGESWWAYKEENLFKQDGYQEMISYLNKLNKAYKPADKIQTLSASSSSNICFLISIILFILLTLAIILIITLQSKKYQQHLNKKDKRFIFTIQNKERTKISRDLHDSVVQTVRAIRTDVEMLKVQPEDLEKQKQIVKEITNTVILLRNICYNLSPAEISLAENKDGQGAGTNHLELLSVIDTLCKQFSQKTNIPCSINTDTAFYVPVFSLEVSKYVIRVFQEILTNIEKHSFATSVNILISNEELEDKEMLKIVVIDDGIGCEQKEMTKNKHHFGVRNIIESMNLIGGKVEFYTKPNEGMNIVLKVPCSRLATEKSEGSTK